MKQSVEHWLQAIKKIPLPKILPDHIKQQHICLV